jgi:hypothetical protein
MQNKRDASLFEPRAKLRTVTVAQRVIKYGRRQGTRAPTCVKALAMAIAISGSSSTMRIERPVRILSMANPPFTKKSRISERLMIGGWCLEAVAHCRAVKDG